MNIIKLKDVIMPETSYLAEFFNKNLKGKYAYWIKMRYIFPLDSLDNKTYTIYEQYEPIKFVGAEVLPHIDLYCSECKLIDFLNVYVDIEATEEANSIKNYTAFNEYTTDYDIDIDKLRIFRTWLAAELLNINNVDSYNILNSNEIHMLEYYKNEMYNDVIKHLSVFGESKLSLDNINTSSCGCNHNISGLYETTLNGLCDAKSIYEKNIHAFMVQTFSNVEFWSRLNVNFLKVFKKYIDNIIKAGLVIKDENGIHIDCQCNIDKSILNNESILTRLSEALGYIIDNNIVGHKNFIYDVLYTWADKLYDRMYWK